MRYKLIGTNDYNNTIPTVLCNRGINDYEKYLLANKGSRNSYEDLDHINDAVELFDRHFQAKNPIAILSDNDVDGACSATLMYKFIKSLDENYDVKICVHQKNKSHGLSDNDFEIDKRTKLLIVPDAGSNDIEEHCLLNENGISCICADHHQVTENIEHSPAIILNNQTSQNYKNKDCCGASITMEFCRALEEYYWEDICDRYLDLVAVANVCDVMSLAELETKAVVNEGLLQINNKLLKEIIKAQDFSIKGVINPHSVGFYVGPLINSFIRLATYDERVLLLRAFCEDESETFDYTKRGEDFPIEENIYEHVVRLMKSYKSKQDRSRDKSIKLIMNKLSECASDKVAIIDATEEIAGPLTGLVAVRISEKINKPVLLVRAHDGALSGSGRVFDNCPVEDFRGLVEENPYMSWGRGHLSAFGCELPSENIELAKQWFNEKLKDVSMEKIYYVDFLLDVNELDIRMIQEIDKNQGLWGHGVDEPLIAVENIKIPHSDIHIQGKNFDSITFTVNDVKFVQFKLQEDDALLSWASDWEKDDDDIIIINVVGTVGINAYKGVYTPQFTIKDSEITIQNYYKES